MSSNFEKVVNFNHQFGVINSTELEPKKEIIKQDPKTVEFCLKLIREEMKELEEAVKENDFIEMVDALGDILYVVYGMGCRCGVDMDTAFNLIHENNMSKLCKTEEEAKLTVHKYKQGTEYDSPTYRKAPDGIHWVVYNESTCKVLKAASWENVNLSKMF